MDTEKPFVIWIDDEPNLVEAEIFELEMFGYQTMSFNYPSQALTYIENNRDLVMRSRALVVDVLMPSGGDPRLQSNDGEPVSVLLCKKIKDTEIWESIKRKLTLYTRLPGGDAVNSARTFASDNELRFLPKTKTSRIVVELKKAGLL